MSSGAETRTRNPSVNSRTLCQLSYPGSGDHRTRLADLPPRVLAKIKPSSTGCWLWTGAIAGNGYGSLGVDGRTRSAHRYVYEQTVGAVPDGLTLDHLCRVRHCVRPEHLDPVPLAENLRRSPNFGANKTACPAGHPLDENNVLRNGNGNRYCRTCHNAARRAKRAANHDAKGDAA